MATLPEKLATSLEALDALQGRGLLAIRSGDLSRTHRERLRNNGFLEEVIKGWYVAARPDDTVSESTPWCVSFWGFCAAYLQYRFKTDWCLSPEQSLSLHAENWTVPLQLTVRSTIAQNNLISLPHGTSLVDVNATVPASKDIEDKDGLRLFSLPAALIACSPRYFRQNPIDMRTVLGMVGDASEVLDRLLEGGHSTVAGRLAGALRNIGRNRIADDIIKTMRAAGHDIRESDPFEAQISIILAEREHTPYVNRIRLMWQEMREPIIERFPSAPGLPKNTRAYLKRVEDLYATDAYHSLSIAGFRVNPELIDRMRSGDWNADTDENDPKHRNALAARGYWLAYQAVRESIGRALQGANPGTITDVDHQNWYTEMFAPEVTAGLLRPADLAGYRDGPVYICRSMHVPPSREAVRDAMPAFFDLLREETNPAVRAVLGHLIFLYIHPYIDGNGRLGRFLMNVMLASGGYPWTVIPLDERNTYRAALENASVNQNIGPFCDFLARLITAGLKGEPAPALPPSKS